MAPALSIGRVALGGRPRIVAAGGEDELGALGAAMEADLVELRADLFDAPSPAALTAALRTLADAARPVILTVRSASEGGQAMSESLRASLYASGLEQADAVDLEIASEDLVRDLVPRARAAGRTVILSAHDFRSTPSTDTLLGLVDRAESLGADLTKLAAHAETLDDVRRLLEVTLAARTRGIVTLAMGPVGGLSRVFFGAAGSLLTYASVGRPTGPGQLDLAELSTLVRRFFPR
jgi:3-dehydroquinate dehydratase-1